MEKYNSLFFVDGGSLWLNVSLHTLVCSNYPNRNDIISLYDWRTSLHRYPMAHFKKREYDLHDVDGRRKRNSCPNRLVVQSDTR